MPASPRAVRLFSLATGRLLALLFALLLGGWSMTAQAFWWLIPGIYSPETYYKFGAVYTRAIVPGPNGRPVYVEYDSSGREAREIGEAVEQFERAQVMSGDAYRSLLQRLQDTQSAHPDAVVMTAENYRAKDFVTVTGEAVNKPSLANDSKTVVVRPDEQLYTADGKDLVLLELPVKSDVTPGDGSKSLLLSEAGDILHQSANSIGLRVGFFSKDGKVSEGLLRDRQAQIHGPLPNVVVTLGGHIGGGAAVTDEQGKYSMHYFLPPCPGFTFEYTTPAYLELYYKRFNPRGSSNTPYYMVRQDYDFCNGLGVYSMAAASVIMTMATPMKYPHDFPIDLMVLDGGAVFKDATLGESTKYSAETGSRERKLQEKYDFDGDEKPDWVVPGKKVKKVPEGETEEIEVFVNTSVEEAELQGIYLSSLHESAPASTEETPPDFTRLIDVAPDFEDRGLLETVSQDDLRDTDIYVFREANGQLVAERRGLHEDELYKNFSGVDEREGSFRYTIQLRGSAENFYALSGRNGEANFTKWQSAGGFQEEFQKRSANHLKAGETVRIIAINRPTGYMGSVRVELQSAAATGNLLNFPSQRIELAPPNLKVWAERKNRIEYGATKGEEKKQLIGNEGAGLGSDVSIAIYTDWRDQDGSPLPEELADYGYTGRLAKIVAANQLAPTGANNLSQFPIKPGQQVQVIHLPEKVLAKQHLYLQVAGQPENRTPDFSSGGQASGILKYRPTHYVPVKVPLHDEEASELARQAWRKADKEKPELELKKPEPLYAWQYRPELQFSMYELNVKEIRRIDADNQSQQILNEKTPTLTNSDKLLEFYYDLLRSEFSELDAWAYQGQKELVLAVGEQEVKATIGADQTIRFDNFDHLAQLDVDDFLTMRLYANNDVANVLFEFAFEYLAVDTTDAEEESWEGEFYNLSADQPTLGLQAWLVGYEHRKDRSPAPKTIWALQGDGALTQPGYVTGNEIGYFQNELTMPTVAGSQAYVTVREQDNPSQARVGIIRVVPGAPYQISLSAQGQASIHEHGEVVVTARVTDKNGNPVADGTPVIWSVEGDASITSSTLDTQGGVVTSKVVGGGLAGTAGITLKVDGVSRTIDTVIQPMNIQVTAPSSVGLDQDIDVTVTVLDTGGAPVPGLFLAPISTVGRISSKPENTDASGRATFRVRTPTQPVSGSVGANIGEYRSSVAVNVAPPGGAAYVGNSVVLVGDQAAAGSVQVDWFNEVKLDVPYKVQDDLLIRGRANEQVEVELGSPGLPVMASVLSYAMAHEPGEGGVVPDRTGTGSGVARNITLVKDSPIGVGNSFEFRGTLLSNSDSPDGQGSQISTALSPAVALRQNTGFRVDIKPANTSGRVFQLGEGQSLFFDEQGRLVYTVKTTSGLGKVESPPLSPDTWHNVAGSYRNGRLELAIHDAAGNREVSKVAVDLQGDIEYGAAEQQLLLGGGYSGRMRGFDLHDWRSRPLVAFADGQTRALVTLDDQGSARLPLSASGGFGLGLGAEAKEILINRIPVMLRRSGATTEESYGYVTLTTTDSYRALVGMQVSAAPPPASVATAGLPMRPLHQLHGLTLPGWITAAHAGWSDWLPSLDEIKQAANQAVDIVAEGVKYIVPYDDAIAIAEQLAYRYNNDPRYNGMLLAASSLSVLSVIPTPFTKVLGRVMKPIKEFARRVGGSKFAIAFAEKFIVDVEKCIDGRGKGASCRALEGAMPFIETMGYMYVEDPDGFMEIVNSIASKDQFLAIFEFLMMDIDPAWFGLEDLLAAEAAQPYMPLMRGMNFPEAYASTGRATLMGRGLLKLNRRLDGNLVKVVGLFKDVSPFLASKSAEQRNNLVKVLVHWKNLGMMGRLVRLNLAEKFMHMVKGYSGQRLPQPFVLAMLYYLLVEKYDEQNDNVKHGITVLIGKAFISMETVDACRADGKNPAGHFNNANGALFHLSRIAGYLIAQQEVEAVEKRHDDVRIVRTRGGKEVVDGTHDRISDIVLKDGKLVETKSYIGKKGRTVVGDKPFGRWTRSADTKEHSVMKEFFLDQIIIGGAEGATKRLTWTFDGFKNEKGCSNNPGQANKGFDGDVKKEVVPKMQQLPQWLKPSHVETMFKKPSVAKYQIEVDKVVNDIVDVFGLEDLIVPGIMNLTQAEIDNLKAAGNAYP